MSFATNLSTYCTLELDNYCVNFVNIKVDDKTIREIVIIATNHPEEAITDISSKIMIQEEASVEYEDKELKPGESGEPNIWFAAGELNPYDYMGILSVISSVGDEIHIYVSETIWLLLFII